MTTKNYTIKKVHDYIYDIFQGQGWYNWTRMYINSRTGYITFNNGGVTKEIKNDLFAFVKEKV